MKLKRAASTISIVTLFCGVSYAEGDAVKDAQRGVQAVKSAKRLPDGYSQTYYLELKFGSKPMGYAELTLTAEKDEKGKLVYHYTHNTKIQAPGGGRDLTFVKAQLDPHFTPMEITVDGRVVTQADEVLVSHHGAKVAPDQIVLTDGSGDKVRTRTIRRPSGLFVSASELLLEQIDIAKYAPFSLATLDPESGRTTRSRLELFINEDMSQEVVAKWGEEDKAFIFELTAEGKLAGWRQHPPTVDVIVIPRERYEELMGLMGLED